jgi:transposase
VGILNIIGLEVDLERTIETADSLTIGVKRRRDGREACPFCGCIPLAPNGSRRVTYRDIPVRGKPVQIEWDRQRFYCVECKKTCPDEHPDLHNKRNMTKRLHEWIAERSLKHTFASVAEDIGVDEKTVRNVFDEWSEEKLSRIAFQTPRVLGIDEVHLLHQARGILTNIEESTMIDLLPGRTMEIMSRRIALMPDKHKVEVVTMDMWRPYRDIVAAQIPHAAVVVDRWHVVKYANEAMETIRKSYRAGLSAKRRRTLLHDRHMLLKRRNKLTPDEALILETWLTAFPDLGNAYLAKEAFFDIYSHRRRDDAVRAYAEWRAGLSPKMLKAFKPLITAMTNWEEPIFAFFDQKRVTNAYTEALNGLVKIANRTGRGYSFDVLRARMLLSYGAYKDPHVLPGQEASIRDPRIDMTPTGIHLPTLNRLLAADVDHVISTE